MQKGRPSEAEGTAKLKDRIHKLAGRNKEKAEKRVDDAPAAGKQQQRPRVKATRGKPRRQRQQQTSKQQQPDKQQPGGGGRGGGGGRTKRPAEGQAAAEGQHQQQRKKKRPGASFQASRQLAAAAPRMEPVQQADWLWENYSEHSGASFSERGALTGDALAPLPEVPGGGGLEARIKLLEPRWQRLLCSTSGGEQGAGEVPEGSPVLLVVSASAVAANEIAKSLPGFNRGGLRVAKLFAKHIKVAEQVQLLQQTRVAIASGTPARLTKLAELGALRLGRLRWVLLDVQLDVKQRTILDIPETRADLWAFFDGHLKPLLHPEGQARLVLFSAAAPPASTSAVGGSTTGAGGGAAAGDSDEEGSDD